VQQLPILVASVLDDHHSLKNTVEIAMRMKGYRLTLSCGLILVMIGDTVTPIQGLVNHPWLGTNLTYGLDRLELFGLIVRRTGDDRRTRCILATERGLRLAGVVKRSLEQFGDRKVA
jgi:hypothetical protein